MNIANHNRHGVDLVSKLARERHAGQRAFERFRRLMTRERRIIPSDVGLPYEPCSLRAADGQHLAGWMVPASGADSRLRQHRCAILVLHHFGGQKATTLPFLELFHRAGLDALAIDIRGHGASAPEIDDVQPSFWACAADAHAGCDLLAARGAQRLVILGQSQAGALAARVAAERDDVTGVILDSGPAPTIELASWGLARQVLGQRAPHGIIARASLTIDILRSGDTSGYARHLWRSLWKLRGRPLLWIHSAGDRVIPRRLAACWYLSCRPRTGRWASITLPGADHIQRPTEGSDVEQAVLEFLAPLATPPSV